MSITPSERTYNTLLQSYNEPEKLNIFQKIIHFIRDILRMDVLDNHLNDIAQRLHYFQQYPNDNELSTLMDTVLELKSLTKSELQKNYEIVQLFTLKKNGDTGEYSVKNDKIIFMYDDTKIYEYTNATYLNENARDVQELFASSGVPTRNGYISCQYKEMKNCFNDIAMSLRKIREENNPERDVDFLNLKTSLNKLNALSEINDFMRANNVIGKIEGEETYNIEFSKINKKLNKLNERFNDSAAVELLNALTNSIYSLKNKIANDKWVEETIRNNKDEINRIKYSEDGGKSYQIEKVKQAIDNIESLTQYCKNALNPGDITKLA